MHPAVLITTLARYQTVFWVPVAQHLREAGFEVALLSFDDPSHRIVSEAGLPSFNAFDLGRSQPEAIAGLERELLDVLGWTLPLAVSHERITFGLRDTAALGAKLMRHRAAAETALERVSAGGRPVVVVQELGGFLSVIGTFLAARARGYDNLFLEPSFFKGRFFATRNTFGAPRVGAEELRGEPEPEALRQLDAATAARAIVIPRKDRHHYTSALRKVVNAANARRLAEKLYEKYGLRQRHEFGYLGAYVRGHARMAVNSIRLRGSYAPLTEAGPFVYYPLHVPADVALTLRAPHYLDQLSLVDYLARTLPATHRLVIKEHPAQVGALDARRLRELLARHDNLLLLAPTTNNYEVLGACDLVVSINSKAGAEALLLGKPVLALGDAFYRDSGLVAPIASIAELPSAIRRALAAHQIAERHQVQRFFSRVWRATLPGELYAPEAENAVNFARSLVRALGQT